MRIPGLKAAKAISRWMRARVLGGALILGYHRVGGVQDDDHEICITPTHFAEQMDALRRYARPMHLSQLVQCLKEGSMPAKSVAVTFDDGYVDNLYEAKPILEKYDVPATIFVCTGYAGKEFWWDELNRTVISSNANFASLHLNVNGKPFMWSRSNAGADANSAARRNFARALYNFLLTLTVEEQSQALHAIRDWSGVSAANAIVRSMTHDELRQIAQDGLIQLGAHTRSHPTLPMLLPERQRDEIMSSKRDLETLLEKRVDGFAYPNGKATRETRQVVRESGFEFACTSLHDVVRPDSDLYTLARFWQKDIDGYNFLRGLRTWM